MSATVLRSKESQRLIVDAIKRAELETSGEIRVHIESKLKKEDPIERALYIFHKLKMHETDARNAVLIYVAYESRKLAIVGDKGINDLVGENYWNDAKDIIVSNFSKDEYVLGIVSAIEKVGNSLKVFFPYKEGDVNEQSDEVSFAD